MNHEADFNQEMKKLISMVRKLLNHCVSPEKNQDKSDAGDSGSVNFNVFIFPMISLSPEEMEEWEGMYDQFFFDESRTAAEDLTTDLTKSDLDFLRRHGIRF